jgi:hypothetical protein
MFESSVYSKEALNESEILYIKYDSYDYNKLLPFVVAISNFELALEPSASVSAYFMTFDSPTVLLNLPDDRFIELCTDSIEIVNLVTKKFRHYEPKVYTK